MPASVELPPAGMGPGVFNLPFSPILCYNPLAEYGLNPPCSTLVVGPFSPRGGGEEELRKYETIFVLRPDLEEEKNAEVIEKFKSLIENNGGEITNVEKWGKRRLAYEINDYREGFYVIVRFNAEPAVASELDRVYKISDEILRHMIVREDE